MDEFLYCMKLQVTVVWQCSKKNGAISCIILMHACIIHLSGKIPAENLAVLTNLSVSSFSVSATVLLSYCHSFFLLSFISSSHLFCTLSLSGWQTVFVIGCLLCWADSCSSVRLLSCQSSEMHITARRRNLNTNITADINHVAFMRQT